MYTFKAWIDERGSNEDRAHAWPHRCFHLRLWDLNTSSRSRNIIRVVVRRRPAYLGVYVGPRYWGFTLGGRRA